MSRRASRPDFGAFCAGQSLRYSSAWDNGDPLPLTTSCSVTIVILSPDGYVAAKNPAEASFTLFSMTKATWALQSLETSWLC